MTQPTQILLAGLNPSDPDNWRLGITSSARVMLR